MNADKELQQNKILESLIETLEDMGQDGGKLQALRDGTAKMRSGLSELMAAREVQDTKNMCVTFGCMADQIARKPEDINTNTKAYVGQLRPGLFDRLPDHVYHIYTSFPNGQRIRRKFMEIERDLNAWELEKILKKKDEQGRRQFEVDSYAVSILRSKEYNTINALHYPYDDKSGKLTLVRLQVRDFGYEDPDHPPTTTELLGDHGKRNGRIHKRGFERCPPKIGPYQRMADKHQSPGSWYSIGMESIVGFDGGQYIFELACYTDGLLCLDAIESHPNGLWTIDRELVVCARNFNAW